MKLPLFPLVILVASFAGCGGDPQSGGTQPAGTPPANTGGSSGEAQKPADHGTAKDLGTLTVAGKQFHVVQFGELVAGREAAFEAQPKGIPANELSTLNAYMWIESQDGTQLSAPEKGLPSTDRLHFHATPKKSEKAPFRVVLRLRSGASDERGSLPLDGHGHEHVEGPHHGIPAKFTGGTTTGHLELKLHDDKGDLELWLANDERFAQPLDLPLDATITVEFVDHKGKKVTLRPRNKTANEDEDGKPNVRNGKTNYFIFPGDTGEDAAWLRGKEFQSIVIVRFTRDQAAFVSEELMLKPHTH